MVDRSTQEGLLSNSWEALQVSLEGVLVMKLAPPDLIGIPSPTTGLYFLVLLQTLLSLKELWISLQVVRRLFKVSILSKVWELRAFERLWYEESPLI